MEAPMRVELVNKDHLPEELARFRGLRLEGTQLKGEDDDGNTPQLRGLGPILMKVLVELGAAREVNNGGTDPAVRRLAELLELQQRAHQQHIEALQQERDHLQEQLDTRLSQLSENLDKLQTKLTQFEEGVDNFKIGDLVGWQAEDDEDSYEPGYIVIGYTDDGKIKVKELETDDIYEVDSGILLHQDELEEDEEIEDDAKPEFAVGEEVGLKSGDGYLVGFVISEVEGPDDNGNFRYKITNPQTNTVNPGTYGAAQLKKHSEIAEDDIVPAAPAPPERQYRSRTGWRAIPGRFGGWMLGRQVAVQNGTYNLLTRGGRRVITEEEAVEYDNSNRRAGIGAAALVAAGVVLAGIADLVEDYFETKHSIPKVRIPRPTIESPIVNSPIHGPGWEVIPPKGAIPAGETIHFYNGNQGNHGFGLATPAGYHWHGNPGDYSVTGPNGARVDHIQWKDNGPMSDGKFNAAAFTETKKRLMRAFPELKAKPGQLFYNDHSGPGRHGWVKHYITYLLPRK